MATIVFRIFPIESHHNATYSFANQLQESGHSVVYTGNQDMEHAVQAQGFSYYTLHEDIFPSVKATQLPRLPRGLLAGIKANRQALRERRQTYLAGRQFDEIIQVLKPDLVIVDSTFTRHVISLYPHNVPFAVLETMISLNRSSRNPPLNAAIIPDGSFGSALRVEYAWLSYFAKRLALSTWGVLMPVKQLARKVGFPVEMIDFDRYFQVGLRNVPELILAPEAFDFPHQKQPNQHYIYTSPRTGRKEVAHTPDYDRIMTAIAAIREQDPQRSRLIYCSFGGMSWRYHGVKPFLDHLIAALRERPHYQLVVSTGTELNYVPQVPVLPNVHLFQKVPQPALLQKTDLMITHGGINTITECIGAGVPMLVYPATGDLDQRGNAARVHYHRLGLAGNLRRDTSTAILERIDQVLSDPGYQVAVTKMRDQIAATTTKGVDVVENMLARQPSNNTAS